MTEKQTLKTLLRYCKARIRELPKGRRGYYWRLKANFERLLYGSVMRVDTRQKPKIDL